MGPMYLRQGQPACTMRGLRSSSDIAVRAGEQTAGVSVALQRGLERCRGVRTDMSAASIA